MHKHGGDVYRSQFRMDYSVNVNPLGTPESVIKAACQGVRHSAQYPDVECRALRAKLAKAEGVGEEQIVFGNGAADLIISLALAKRPRKVLLPAPTFSEYGQAVGIVGSEIVYDQLSEAEGFRIGEGLLEKITRDMDMVFLCNPNNPTGLPLEKAFLLRVLEKCRENQVLLVVDECFNGFLDEPSAYSVKDCLGPYPNLFILKAFTKVYAMAGLRLGYGFSSDRELLAAMREVNQPWNVSIPAQYAGVAALDETEYVKRSRAMVAVERDYLKQGLREQGFRVFDSQANYIFFYAFPGFPGEMEKKGILIRDCGNYIGLKEGYCRVAVKTRGENQELLKVIREVMEWQRQS